MSENISDWIQSRRSARQREVGISVGVDAHMTQHKTLSALDAVVELHAPERATMRCSRCGEQSYPCPTVAAIADALGVDSLL